MSKVFVTGSETNPQRVQPCNLQPVNGAGDFVLYWMIANRRRHWNFALQQAVHWAVELRKPLLIVESLSCSYRWASTRIHIAVLQGMRDNLRDFSHSGVAYYPFVERFPGHGKGMIHATAQRACVVVTDDFPAFEIPHWIDAVAARSPVRVEKVDSNGIFPMRATERTFTTAHSFRRFLQKELRPHLQKFPIADALADVELPKCVFPSDLRQKWPAATLAELSKPERLVTSIPIDRSVPPVTSFAGGSVAALNGLKHFLKHGLPDYVEARNQPESDTSSGLSPYLHFGHISAHEIFHTLTRATNWSAEHLNGKATGSRAGWWGGTPNLEAFLDQLITWRELGFNMCAHANDYDRYDSLPAWARKTLADHAADTRPVLYSNSQLENGTTHDALWNAAQMQLVKEGRIHNYLRMLWGKKILEWSPTPADALETMIHLNNKYALDGRDPNSYSGIFWTLGRYDRPWGPQRPIFGSVRYMSSDNTARKVAVRKYMERYGSERPEIRRQS